MSLMFIPKIIKILLVVVQVLFTNVGDFFERWRMCT